MITFIVGLIFTGLIVGFIARAVLPGRDSMGILATILVGIAGSFIGGLIGRLLFNSDGAGWLLSILGAVLLLLVLRRTGSRSRARV